MILEICANSFQSAKNAQDAGAQRIELCSELCVGGVTPSYGLIKQVTEDLSIETYVLTRPRSGNFTYSDAEFEIMKRDIQVCKDLGCSGIVSGVLNEDQSLDIERTQILIEIAKPLTFTFHRAFDCIPNPIETLEQLIALGVNRILTSGQEVSAEKGMKLLKTLNEKANKRIIILPGSGIHLDNAKLFKAAGFIEIHASASKVIQDKNKSSYFGEIQQTVSDFESIKSIIKSINDEM
ncbi:copper homeostasis protein CutC [Lacinutrix iliipiscaria]|uniref:PF03932 family protein CutC n=1 Tax=Lacinutrix iliipiscaria TaxID=1230532 RepID=A0ABW5WJ24_9FLAO